MEYISKSDDGLKRRLSLGMTNDTSEENSVYFWFSFIQRRNSREKHYYVRKHST